ncbi:vitellogenin [Nephila pilipes]|uniref:Vitellogenin n=1 Tax=Nephila pilipes TaxID=299642 RepID=A0A8X6UIB3_NEPPI|nr:vitellogenin [Nephila pilipes]
MGLNLFLLACMVGAAFAGPLYKDLKGQCVKSCNHPSNSKFKYDTEKIYKYSSENTVTYAGNQKQTSTIKGIAEIHPVSKCEFLLKMTNIEIDQKLTKEEQDQYQTEMEKPVLFTFDNGKVDHVCPSSSETPQSLNIKKGVISSLINTMTRLDTPEEVEETDSMGRCRTKYTVENTNVIKKEKDLSTCTNRQTLVTYFLKNKSPNLFKDGYSKCVQFIKDKCISKVECIEREKMKTPFKDSNFVEFNGKIKLEIVNRKPTQNVQMQGPISQEELLYSIEDSRKGDTSKKEVENTLRRMCTKNSLVVDINIGSDYIRLVSLVKQLNKTDMEQIYSSLKNGRLCPAKKVRDMFVDSLLFAGTDAAVKFMVKLIQDGDITGVKAKIWAASFALIPNPTKETVAAIIPLVKMDDSAPVMLGVSAMIHKVCSKENCDELSPVKEVISILKTYLGDNCSSEETDKVLTACKAFGNMGYLGEAYSDIVSCVEDSSKPIRVRLAAIDGFRRILEKRPENFLKMLQSKDTDPELKIALYARILEQADEHQLKELKETIERETDMNVSGYVYSYLRNVNKTSSRRKQKIKKLLNNFPINQPRDNNSGNSKNIEMSTFLKALNIGGSFEADIIGSPGSDVPRSLKIGFEADLFDNIVKLFQINMRAEGLEKLVKKFIGFKNKVTKVKPSWNFLNSKDILGDNNAEFSILFRFLDTEFLDFSDSDMSSIGEMIQIAEIMKKLARGRNADLSHSFVFLNSKLVIPSVTGRSYSIDFTGSSSIGLTARSKLNVLGFPRNVDIDVHFQPSLNVYVQTTIGIQSNQHRPDIKLESRLHLESDLELKAQVKDGHVAVASLNMPSENIGSIKLSTDVLEIDANHNERRLFDKRQKKIDHCFRCLEKPLGVATCISLEVSKPLLMKTFPFTTLVGSTEIAFKKTDKSFSKYELRLEIPKNVEDVMKYKASFDTPGSRFSRRFAADLEVKQHREHKEILLQLTSPFKKIGGQGSYTWSKDLIQGSLEIYDNSKNIFEVNLNTKISSSKSRKSYQTTGKMSCLNYEPLSVNSSIAVTDGRKRQIKYEFTFNKPKSKPTTLKGSITTEGSLKISEKSEFKLSSDCSIHSPQGQFQLRNILEKRSKKYPAISLHLGMDYQMARKRKHSMSISGSFQKNSGKVNTNVKLEMTEYPGANLYFIWDKQGDIRHNLRNNMTLKYGHNPESTYIRLMQSYNKPSTGPGECRISLEIPQRSINYELTLKHDLELSKTPKLFVEADLCNHGNTHSKIHLDVNYESKSPLKATSKLEILHPGVYIVLQDEIVQTSKNVIDGTSRLQYKQGKEIELKYKYEKLSDEFKFHHKIEGSLKTPSSSNPIKSKASIQLSKESLVIVGEIDSKYSAEAHLNRAGVSHITLKALAVEGTLKISNDDLKKTVDMDLKLKRPPRHITISILADLREKKTFKLSFVPNVDQFPDNKFYFSTIGEISESSYIGSSKLQVLNFVDFSLTESGDVSFYGTQDCALEISIKDWTPISLVYKHEIGEEKVNSVLTYSRNHVEKAKIELEGNVQQDRYKRDILGKVSITSLDHSFEDITLLISLKKSGSGRSSSVKSLISFQKNSNVYKAEFNSDLQPDGIDMKTEMNTPIPNYEKQIFDLSLKRISNGIISSVSIETHDNKKISITTDIKKTSHGFIADWIVLTPFDNARNVKTHLDIDNHSTKKSMEAYLDINNEKIAELQVRYVLSRSKTEIRGNLKIPKVELQKFHALYQTADDSTLVSGKIELADNKEFSVTAQVSYDKRKSFATASIATPFEFFKDAKVYVSQEEKDDVGENFLFYFDRNGKRKTDIEITYVSSSNLIEIQGRLKTINVPEISTHFKYEKSGESFSISTKILKGTSPLLSTSFKRESSPDAEKLSLKTESFEKTLLNLEVSKDVSEDRLSRYSVKVRGEFSPLSIIVKHGQNDGQNDLTTKISLCRKKQRNECYSLKSYHKNMISSGNNGFHRKVSIDLEKSIDESNVEALGSLHILFTLDEHDYRSKVTFQLNEKMVGYDIKYHHRKDENDHCTLDTQLYLLKGTSRVKGSIVLNDYLVDLEIDVVPNTDQATRKLSIEMKKEISRESKELSGYLKLSHPDMSQPLLFTYKLQEVEKMLIRAKLELHFSSAWGKGVTLEIDPDLNQESLGVRTMVYKLYTEDKNLDASLKLRKKSTIEEDEIGFDWVYKCKDVNMKGGAFITLSEKIKGRPHSMKIAYYSPSSDILVVGSAAQAPDDVSLSLVSKGQKLKEIRFKTSEHCTEVEVSEGKREPFVKSSVCILKQEGEVLHLLELLLHYRRHKSLDISLNLDPAFPAYVDVVIEWKKEDLHRILNEVTGWDKFLHDRSLKDIEREIKKKLEHLRKDIVYPSIKMILRDIKQIKEDIFKTLRDIIRGHSHIFKYHIENVQNAGRALNEFLETLIPWNYIRKEILIPLEKTIRCFIKETGGDIVKHIPDFVKSAIGMITAELHHCWEKFCPVGSLCYNVVDIFHYHKLKQTISKTLEETKRSLSFPISFIKDIVDVIISGIVGIKKELESIFGKFLGDLLYGNFFKLIKDVEEIIRKKIVAILDEIIQKINDIFTDDEDYKTAKALLVESKEKLRKIWADREQIIENALQPFKESIKRKINELADKQYQIVKYDPEGGLIKLRVHQLFGPSEVEILKNELRAIKRKLKKSLEV